KVRGRQIGEVQGLGAVLHFDPANVGFGSDSVIRRYRLDVRFARKRTRVGRLMAPPHRPRPRTMRRAAARATWCREIPHFAVRKTLARDRSLAQVKSFVSREFENARP